MWGLRMEYDIRHSEGKNEQDTVAFVKVSPILVFHLFRG